MLRHSETAVGIELVQGAIPNLQAQDNFGGTETHLCPATLETVVWGVIAPGNHHQGNDGNYSGDDEDKHEDA